MLVLGEMVAGGSPMRWDEGSPHLIATNLFLQYFLEGLHRSLVLDALYHLQVGLCEVVGLTQVGASEWREGKEVKRLIACDKLLVVGCKLRVGYFKLLAIVVRVIFEIVAIGCE